MNPKLWPIDADNIIYNEKTIFYSTERIKSFLSKENDTQSFIIATKGIGKTFLLNMKKMMLRKSFIFIPKSGIDKFTANRVQSDESINLFVNPDTIATLWSASIILAALKSTGFEFNEKEEIKSSLIKIYNDGNVKRVTDFFSHLISSGRDNFFRLHEDFNNSLIPHYRNINTPIAIFIDNIDEYFRDHLERNNVSIDAPVPDLWYSSQMGLILSFFDLHKLNHHIRLFATIRKEAYYKYQGEIDLFQQLSERTLELSYTTEELRELFVEYIRGEKDDKFIYPGLRKTNVIKAFFGFDKISHEHLMPKQEDLIQYIIRHTLSRPRDLMQIGFALSNIGKNERRDEQKFKDIVHDESKKIVENYRAEVKPYIEDNDFDDNYTTVLKHIESNALPRDELIVICSLVNKTTTMECRELTCEQCKKNHIFCTLYKIGFIGTVYNEGTAGMGRQVFSLPGEKIFMTGHLLPESDVYLIHPILNQMIMEVSKKFMDKRNKENIIGNGLIWKYEEEGKNIPKGNGKAVGSVKRIKEEYKAVLKADICNFSDMMSKWDTKKVLVFKEEIQRCFTAESLKCEYVKIGDGDSICVADKSVTNVCGAGFFILDTMFEKELRIRIALDYGIVTSRGETESTGLPYLRSARIEPYVSPNQLWGTTEFKDMLVKKTNIYTFIDLFQETPDQADQPDKKNTLKEIKRTDGFCINKSGQEAIFVKLYRIKRRE
jgi:hypothetical protein